MMRLYRSLRPNKIISTSASTSNNDSNNDNNNETNKTNKINKTDKDVNTKKDTNLDNKSDDNDDVLNYLQKSTFDLDDIDIDADINAGFNTDVNIGVNDGVNNDVDSGVSAAGNVDMNNRKKIFRPILKRVPLINEHNLKNISDTVESNTSKKQKKTTKKILHEDIVIDETIQNTDLLLILRRRLKATLKSNLLIRVINPFKFVEPSDVIRICAHVFLLLIFGFASNFYFAHVVVLPIIVQNVIDLLF
jgi:hypothetical protein